MRRKTLAKIVPLLVLALALSSCQSVGQGIADNPKATGGGMLGAAGGGLIAAAAGGGAAGIIGGVLIGGLLGGALGSKLDQNDKELAQKNAQQTFENTQTGQASTWQNPDSGNSGSITPTRTYETDGRYCHEYQQEITVGGELEKSYGTACRQPDGSWKVDS